LNTENLKRTIGFVSATSIGLGAMLGAGIFVFPGLAGGQAGFGAIFSFMIGGIIALAVAACTSELATAMPRSGGAYFFISRTFGKFSGTVTGIAQWIGLVFACAFYLSSFGEYALTILEELNIQWNVSAKIFSFCFTLILLVINLLGTKKVGQFQNLLVISLTIVLVLIFTYGLFDYLGIRKHPPAFSEIKTEGIGSLFTTTALIFTAYLGFVQIANIGAEIKNPNKNLPRSLIWSVVIAMILYAFIMFACVSSISQEELKEFGETATIEVARKLLGNWGAIVVLFGGLLAALSSANASMISASRGVYAISNDKLISKKASKINKRFGTPHIALILITVPTAFILIRSRIEIFAEVASFLHLIIYAGICVSVLKLRSNNPNWYIPTFRIPFVKIIAGLGAICCLGLIFFMQRMSILISLGVLLLAVMYYLTYVNRRKIKLSGPNPPHIDSQIVNPDILIPIDISEEKKDLPAPILKAIPISNLLLLGYKETPEQTEAEQSEDEYSKEGKEKLEKIEEQMKEAQYSYDSNIIFGNKIFSQINQLIDDDEFQIILFLKPHTALNRVVIPVYDSSQINTKLSTLIYNLQSQNRIDLKFILFIEGDESASNELQLKNAIEEHLSVFNITTLDYEVLKNEDLTSKNIIQKLVKHTSDNGDLVLWSELETHNRKDFLKLINDKASKEINSPMIIITKKKERETKGET